MFGTRSGLAAALALGMAAAQRGYEIDAYKCSTCYFTYNSCINEDFATAECCLDQLCRDKYKYCSTNLLSKNYKALTCPIKNCPAGPMTFKHMAINSQEKVTRQWGLFDNGFNCKYIVNADSKLNGKIILNIEEVTNAFVNIYLQPNTFNQKEFQTHGILENNKEFV